MEKTAPPTRKKASRVRRDKFRHYPRPDAPVPEERVHPLDFQARDRVDWSGYEQATDWTPTDYE